ATLLYAPESRCSGTPRSCVRPTAKRPTVSSAGNIAQAGSF
ncbi:uncharacterized protein METZ01_LOCUS473047, partial [marine metagenome]